MKDAPKGSAINPEIARAMKDLFKDKADSTGYITLE